MRLVAIAAAVAGLLTSPAICAAGCRDVKGKFVKCDQAGATGTQGNVTKGKDGKCRIVTPALGQRKGQFAPCPK